MAVFFNLIASNTNAVMQQFESELAPQLAAHEDAILLDPKLFARVSALYERRTQLGLEPEGVQLLERYHTQFVRAGARLPEAQKSRSRRSTRSCPASRRSSGRTCSRRPPMPPWWSTASRSLRVCPRHRSALPPWPPPHAAWSANG